MEEFRVRLQKAMDIRGLRQQDIIEKTGIGSSAISQYLSGRNKPKQDKIYKLAVALDVNPAWLMGFEEHIERRENMPISSTERRLVESFRTLTSEDQAKILERIAVFLEADKYQKKGNEAVG